MGPEVLSQWFEHGLAVVLMSLASLSIGVHVWQSRQLARQLQGAADSLDDAQLLALLPPMRPRWHSSGARAMTAMRRNWRW